MILLTGSTYFISPSSCKIRFNSVCVTLDMPPCCNTTDITQSIIFFFFYREFFARLYLYEILIIVAYHDLQSIGETRCTVQHDEEPKCRDIIEISHSCLKQFYRRKCFTIFFHGYAKEKSIKKIFIDKN